MKAVIEAVFEDGVFKPVERPAIPEGESVLLAVETAARREQEDPLELAARVYQGLRPEEIDEIERIALGRTPLLERLIAMNEPHALPGPARSNKGSHT